LNNATPLHVAAYYDAVDCVTILLNSGANTEIKDNLGETPLDIAQSKHLNCANILKLHREFYSKIFDYYNLKFQMIIIFICLRNFTQS